jgi:DNA (cytosine-5)-methyltransferase 1
MNELALFAGAGGGILASKLLGWNTVAAVEIEKYPREVLLQRQRDGILNRFPIWDDVRTFDGKPWRGKVDVITGGFPCQDISPSGKGGGIAGERSGLWKEFARIIGEIEPQFAFIENSPVLRTRGLGTVLQDLAEMGYAARWCVLGAWHVGANHKRDRMWVLAYPNYARLQRGVQPNRINKEERQVSNEYFTKRSCLWWTNDPANSRTESDQFKADPPSQPIVGRLADGVAKRVDRLKATGNGQVPLVAATAFRLLSEGLVW